MNPDGTLVATSSVSGTRIKIWSVESGQLLQELRRGSTHALVTGIVFHPSLNVIAACSDKSTVHIFEFKMSVEKSLEQKHFGFSEKDADRNTNTEGNNKRSS